MICHLFMNKMKAWKKPCRRRETWTAKNIRLVLVEWRWFERQWKLMSMNCWITFTSLAGRNTKYLPIRNILTQPFPSDWTHFYGQKYSLNKTFLFNFFFLTVKLCLQINFKNSQTSFHCSHLRDVKNMSYFSHFETNWLCWINTQHWRELSTKMIPNLLNIA